jgi:putative transposase
VKKSRFFLLHPECNQGKIDALEALYVEYRAYVGICIQTMLDARKLNLPRSAKQGFFPEAEALSSQIEKNARDHAIQIVSTWAKAVYARKLKTHIRLAYQNREIDDDLRKQLYTIGKHLIGEPWKFVTQEAIDLYWVWLTDVDLVGRLPSVSNRVGMRLSEMTGKLQDPQEAVLADLWLNLSTLVRRKVVWLPLVGNPYVKRASDVSKGIMARKDRRGRWRFEAVDKKEWDVPEAVLGAPRIGVDVGLNVIAATSEGHTFGSDLKPKFDTLYGKVRSVRANRHRQGLKENSKRLDRLEDRLSGMTKSFTGKVANQLVERHPDAVFILEDLDLRGCRGSKRFCYRALAHSLETKAPTEAVNPAYSSQTCPSCGHVSRRNRKGIDFVCRQCGRRSHADVVGGINLLGRSELKQIGLDDHPSEVKEVLVRLYWARGNPDRECPQDFLTKHAPSPYGRRLTTKARSKDRFGTASNQVAA